MKLISYLLLTFHFSLLTLLPAQNLESYHHWRQQGIESYETGQFEQAINELKLARIMDDRPASHDLEQWIDKAYNGYVNQLMFERNRSDSLLKLVSKRAIIAETLSRINEIQNWDRRKAVLALSILRENLRLLKQQQIEAPPELLQLIFSKIVGQLSTQESPYSFPLPKAIWVHHYSVKTARFSPIDQKVLTLSQDNIVRLLGADGALLAEVRPTETVQQCRFSPNGQHILILTDSATLCFDETGKQWAQIQRPKTAHNDWHAAFMPANGQSIFTWSNTVVDRWSLKGDRLLHFESEAAIQQLIVQPEKDQIFILANGHAYLLNLQGQLLASTALPDNDRYDLLSARENWIISLDSIVYTWREGSSLQVLYTDTKNEVIELSPNQSRLVIGTEDQLIFFEVNESKIKRRQSVSHQMGRKTDAAQFLHIDFSPDEQFLLTRWTHDTLAVLRDQNGKPLAELSHGKAAISAANFSPDGQILITLSEDGRLNRWSRDGTILTSPNIGLNDFRFSHTGEELITRLEPQTATPGFIKTWNQKDSLLSEWAYFGEVKEQRFSSDSLRLLIQQDEKTIAVVDERPTLVSTFQMPPQSSDTKLRRHRRALYSPKGKHILTQSVSGLNIWDQHGNSVAQIKGESLNISFSPDGSRFISQEYDAENIFYSPVQLPESLENRIRLRDLNGTLLKDLGVGGGLSFSPRGTYLYDRTGSRIWNNSGELVHNFEIKSLMWHDIQSSTAVISPSDSFILLLRNRFEVEVRNLDTGTKEFTIDRTIIQDISRNSEAFHFAVPRNTFAPDGQSFLLSVEKLGLVHLNVNGSKLGFIENRFSHDFHYARNGKSLFITSKDSLTEWDLDTHTLRQRMRFPGTLLSQAFVANSHRAIISRNDSLFLYDLEGKQSTWLGNNSNSGRYNRLFTWSKDRKYLLYRAAPTVVTLFDHNGNVLIRYDHHAVITSSAFSPDGKYVLTATQSGQALRWPIPQTIYDWLDSDQCPIPELTEEQQATYGLEQ